jgi:sialate O-acetylesterase
MITINLKNKAVVAIKSGLVICLALVSLQATGKVRLPALISDNMVLQQQSKVALWGWSAPGERVSIRASWLKKPLVAMADATGKWTVYMSTAKAGGPYQLSFIAGDTLTVNNVLLGEVWLASGQSNMEFPVGKGAGWKTGVPDHEQVIAAADFPQIRMIDVENTVADSAQQDFKGAWKVCSPATVPDFSAVGYFFAREISRATGAPVGIINSTWGGTPAESWTRREVLAADPELAAIVSEYQATVANYPALSAAYKEAVEKRKQDTAKVKGPAPKALIGPTSNKSPYKLYNGMIAPLIPYTLKGVIWYQGESNATRAIQYRHLFPVMINNWRTDWKQADLPFYFVQIAPHKGQNPEIREAQLMAYRSVPNTGIVVITDHGDSSDIHPRNKEVVGKRLSRWALHNEYKNKDMVVSGPLYRSMKIEGQQAIVSFDFADGLKTQGNATVLEFEIAGDDRQFVPAIARIQGDRIVVESKDVKKPVAVRFAWKNVPHPNLYNSEDLPASPFRTDNW